MQISVLEPDHLPSSAIFCQERGITSPKYHLLRKGGLTAFNDVARIKTSQARPITVRSPSVAVRAHLYVGDTEANKVRTIIIDRWRHIAVWAYNSFGVWVGWRGDLWASRGRTARPS